MLLTLFTLILPQGLDSLDEDDPNILLAIQLSLQESRMAGSGPDQDVLANEASLGAFGTSLPSRLEQRAPGVEVPPRASFSSSELLELGDNLARLGAISSQYSAAAGGSISVQHRGAHQRGSRPGGRTSSTGHFSSSTDSPTCSSHDPSSSSALPANANLLGNIMAWFHDMNPQGITLVPPMSSDTDSNVSPDLACREEYLQDDERKPQETPADRGFCPQRASDLEEKECVVAERPTQLDLVGVDAMTLPYMAAALDTSGELAEGAGSKRCHVDTPRCDSGSDQLPSTSSSEWEGHLHLV